MISNRIGLVLSGGGAKGAYEVGVVKCLSDMNISIDAISGASIGALNGAIVAAERDLNIAATHLQEIWYTLAAKSPIKVKGIEIGSYLGLMLVSGQTPLLTQKINTLFELAKLQAQFSENLGILKESPIHNLLDKYLNLKKIRTGLPLYVSVYESQGSLNDLLATLLAAINLVNTRPPQFLHIQSLDQTQQRNAILASAAIPLLFKARQVNKTYYAWVA
jgi:NTE family protein